MKCTNCGNEFEDGHGYCPNCGFSTSQSVNTDNVVYTNPTYQNNSIQQEDEGSKFGWGVLGCCIPLAGLILFLVWKDQKPKTAKAAGIGALISVISYFAFYFLIFAIGAFGSVM